MPARGDVRAESSIFGADFAVDSLSYSRLTSSRTINNHADPVADGWPAVVIESVVT